MKAANSGYYCLMNRIIHFIIVSLLSAPAFAQLNDPLYAKLIETNDSKEAKPLIAELEKKYPDNGYVLMQKGYCELMLEDDVNASLITLSKAVQLLPGNDELLTTRAVAFFRKGLTNRAIADQEKAIELSPEKVVYYIKLGNYQFSKEKYELALATFLRGIQVNPATAEIYGDAFATYSVLKRFGEAEQLFYKGLEQKGIDTGFLRCYYGKLLMNFQRFDQAAQQFELAHQVEEPHMYAEDYNNAGVANYKAGNLDKAIFYSDIALKKRPYDVGYLLNRGSFAIEKKDWEMLISLSKRALEEDENNAIANMMMSIGLKWGRNDLEKSAAYEKRAHELEKSQQQK